MYVSDSMMQGPRFLSAFVMINWSFLQSCFNMCSCDLERFGVHCFLVKSLSK